MLIDGKIIKEIVHKNEYNGPLPDYNNTLYRFEFRKET